MSHLKQELEFRWHMKWTDPHQLKTQRTFNQLNLYGNREAKQSPEIGVGPDLNSGIQSVVNSPPRGSSTVMDWMHLISCGNHLFSAIFVEGIL